MGGCSVVGCKNRFTRGKLHFYRFPKDARKAAWVKFTRKGNNFQPKGSSTICEKHFAKECFMEKKDRVHLSKDAVPTIFFKQTSLGLEMVQVSYDYDKQEYFGAESIELHHGSISVEDEAAITSKRQEKLDELKTICRFCFCFDPKNESKCVPISKLDAYHIDLNDLLVSLNLVQQPSEIFSQVVCEQCFQQIVDFDIFKKKCREAQDEVFDEIHELEMKIQEIQNKKANGKVWFKSETGLVAEEPQTESATIEILEEHLVDDEEFDESYEFEPQISDQQLEHEEYIEEIHDGYKIIYQQLVEPLTGEERLLKEIAENEIIADESFESAESCQTIEVVQELPETVTKMDDDDKAFTRGVDVYTEITTDHIIKNPERNRFCFRIYECFFCKMKFAGRKTYVAHKCSVSEVKCEQCDKVFNKIQAYNSHVSHVHGSLPISKHFCPLCKTVIMSTLNQFKQHRRQCNKETRNQPIECEICSKMCNNLKGYTIHKLFHDTRNFTTSTGEKIVTDGLNKGLSICEVMTRLF